MNQILLSRKAVLLLVIFSLTSPLASARVSGTGLQCPVIAPVTQGFLAHHFGFKKISPELEVRTIDQYINKLDPSKLYLLESDVNTIRSGLRAGAFSKSGVDCEKIEAAHQVLIQRLEEASAFAKKVLEKDYKFNENIELALDPKLRKWPKTKKEAEDIMLKFIHFQISNYMAADMKLPQAKKQLIHRYELNVKRQKDMKTEELYSIFLDSFAGSLDAHSSFLSRDTLEDFEISMRLSLDGIGAALTWEDGYTTVDSLIPGGSAERSNELRPKDKIIAVAQGDGEFEQVIDMPLRDVVKLIRGKKGTTVRLSILREAPKATGRHIISLKRDKIKLEDEAAKLLVTTRKIGDRTVKIGIIDLPSFYGDMTSRTRSCYEDMKKLIEKAKAEKVDGIVLDLSRNGGGLLSEAVRIAGLFIKKGNVVATQDSQQKMDILSDSDSETYWSGPLALMTSRLSASASEIVSGALKDYKRAIIVGSDHTFGKGTVQAMINLPSELGAIKVTTGMFFLPGGKSTQHLGVKSDIEIPSIFSTKDMGEASLDYSLPEKSLAAFVSSDVNDSKPESHWNPVEDSVVSKLKTLSAARVEKDAEFKKIRDDLAEIERKKGIINLAQSLKKQKEEKKKNPEKKQAGRGKRKKSDEEYLKLPQVGETVQVLTDFISLTSSQKTAAR